MPTCKSSASPGGGKHLIVIKNSALTLKLSSHKLFMETINSDLIVRTYEFRRRKLLNLIDVRKSLNKFQHFVPRDQFCGFSCSVL